ncbi:testicular acid phosphatase homolog [Adelges cooleyi]|uniref:testicular acid phosphatase homolog n=1 Tax=Adelges cooleyi TaxID=133065 RepID=UPI0021803E14|nr:testicular acid phosphatase homolog [Adelges cooleyi]
MIDLLKMCTLLLLISVTCCTCNANNSNDFQLKFVFILTRHGNRAPIIQYKNNTNRINWPRGLGELTDQGIWNAYRAGQALRERYISFLNPSQRYIPSEIDVSTTTVDRCYQTAGYLLAGMYPPNKQQTWNADLKWQPVPIKMSLSRDHHLFVENANNCPKYWVDLHEECENAMKTEKVKSLVNYMKNYTSNPLNTMYEVLQVCDVIWTERMANYSIPSWAIKRFNDIEDFMLLSMKITNSKSDQMKRLFSGDLLGNVLNRMNAVLNKSPDAKKIYLHVGHDSTIVPLLNALNIPGIVYPYYGAAVLMELYATPSNETLVKLLYNKNYEWKESNIQLLELPGCPSPCGLDNWRTLTQKIIPQNLSEECKL